MAIILPAHPGWVGLYRTDPDEPIWYGGNVIAWSFEEGIDDPAGITEYGQALYVVGPGGCVTELCSQFWPTLDKFLDKNIVDMETVEILRRRFPL